MVINPILNAIPNLEPRDMSHFDVLKDNLPNLIINLVFMWITAGFLEEFLWRGYLIEWLIDLFGSQTKLTWAIVVIISAVIFGLGHGYQGTMGMFKTGAIGFVLGLSYLAVRRNLWPLIISHTLIDSIDFETHYFGGQLSKFAFKGNQQI
jgi:membrane protease YdiL (CAAX protease family)